jgi:uncharacterized protein with HEPN domain
MPPTLADRVVHILEAINLIQATLAGVSYDDFKTDQIRRFGIERLLEIVCEASRHVPPPIKASEPGIPWQRITDFGNRLRHAYHQIDADIVWRIIQEDLGALKAFVERVIRESNQ